MRLVLFLLLGFILTSTLAQINSPIHANEGCESVGPHPRTVKCPIISALNAGPASKIAIGASAALLPKWCVNVHMSEPETPAQIVTLMNSIGANCVRDSLNWDWVERTPGVYNWNHGSSNTFQTWWNVLCGAGFTAIMTTTYNNPLYSNGRTPFQVIAPGANTKAYVDFNVAAANHFAPTCPGMILELFNEENLVIWTKAQWDGGAYAMMAETTAAAIKVAQPAIAVWSGGLSYGPGMEPPKFGAQMVNAVTMSDIDAYALHPYDYDNGGTPSATKSPQWMLYILQIFNKAASRQPKPTPITEHNFPLRSLGDGVCTNPATANMQGMYLGWSMLLAVAGQVPAYAAYELVNEHMTCKSDATEWGLFFNPGDKPSLGIRPTGVAFSNITSFLKNATSYDVVYYADTSIYAITVHYSGGGRGKAIIQSPNGATAGTPLLTPVVWSEDMGSFSGVTATDVLGSAVPLTVAGTNVSFPLSQIVGPVIVRLP